MDARIALKLATVFFAVVPAVHAQQDARVESAVAVARAGLVDVGSRLEPCSVCASRVAPPLATSWNDFYTREAAGVARPQCPPGVEMPGLCNSASAGPPAPLSSGLREPLTEAEARAIFDYVRVMPMGWNYVFDGCYARAHMLSRFLETNGIMSRKVFVDNRDARYLGPTPRPAHFQAWPYHTATIVNVRRGAEIVPLVLDPALTRWPVTIDEWRRAQGGEGCTQVQASSPRATTGTDCVSYTTERYQRLPLSQAPPATSWGYDDLNITCTALPTHQRYGNEIAADPEAASRLMRTNHGADHL